MTFEDEVQNISKRIKELRESFSMTQRDLANTLEIRTNYLSLLENGKRTPSVSLLYRMGTVFEVPLEYFFLK